MKSHSRKIGISKAKEIGLKVVDMGEDRELEKLVLDIHRAYMATLTASGASKIIENHKDRHQHSRSGMATQDQRLCSRQMGS